MPDPELARFPLFASEGIGVVERGGSEIRSGEPTGAEPASAKGKAKRVTPAVRWTVHYSVRGAAETEESMEEKRGLR